MSTLCLQFKWSRFWRLATTAWEKNLSPPPPHLEGTQLKTGHGAERLASLHDFESLPQSLASVLKVKLVIRYRIRKGCLLATLQSDWGEDNALLFSFSVPWSTIHLLGSPREWKLALFFLRFWQLRAILVYGLSCSHLLEPGLVEERC